MLVSSAVNWEEKLLSDARPRAMKCCRPTITFPASARIHGSDVKRYESPKHYSRALHEAPPLSFAGVVDTR